MDLQHNTPIKPQKQQFQISFGTPQTYHHPQQIINYQSFQPHEPTTVFSGSPNSISNLQVNTSFDLADSYRKAKFS
jgi:hypothetical protein